MNEQEVKSELAKYDLAWNDFLEWMIGQTYSCDQGKAIYYYDDVERFILKKMGFRPIWD